MTAPPSCWAAVSGPRVSGWVAGAITGIWVISRERTTLYVHEEIILLALGD